MVDVRINQFDGQNCVAAIKSDVPRMVVRGVKLNMRAEYSSMRADCSCVHVHGSVRVKWMTVRVKE